VPIIFSGVNYKADEEGRCWGLCPPAPPFPVPSPCTDQESRPAAAACLCASGGATPAAQRDSDPAASRTTKPSSARSPRPRRGAAHPLRYKISAASPAPYRAPLLTCSPSQLAADRQARSRCLLQFSFQHGCCQLCPRLRRQGPPATKHPSSLTNA